MASYGRLEKNLTVIIISLLLFSLGASCADNSTAYANKTYVLDDFSDVLNTVSDAMYQHNYFTCDATTGWVLVFDAQNLETSTTRKEGPYSIQWDKGSGSSSQAIVKNHNLGGVDISDYEEGYISFWFYLPDITNFNRMDFILGSNYLAKQNTYTVDDSALATGWNYVVVDLTNPASQSGGGLDWSDFDDISFSFYTDAAGDLLIDMKLDNLRIYKNAGGMHYQHGALQADQTDNWVLYNDAQNLETTTSNKQGQNAIQWDKGAGTSTVSRIDYASLNGADVSNYYSGIMAFWVYLSSISDLSRLRVYLSDAAFSNRNTYDVYDSELSNGWNLVIFDLDAPDAVSGTGTPWTALDYIRFQFEFDASGNILNDMRLDDIRFIYSNVTIDHSGNGHHGTVYNFETDEFDNKNATFDGVDDYIIVSDHNDLDMETEGSICFWEYHENADDNVILEKGTSASGNYNYLVIIGSINNYYICFDGSCGTQKYLTMSQWNHLCFVNDESGNLKYYLNGVETNSEAGISMNSDSNDLTIGRDEPYNWYLNNLKLNDLMLFDRALSLNEVFTLYNKDFTNVSYPIDYVLYFPFSNTTGMTKFDLSTNYANYLAPDLSNVRVTPADLDTWYDSTDLYVNLTNKPYVTLELGGENNFEETHTSGSQSAQTTIIPGLATTGATIYRLQFYNEHDGHLWSPWSDTPSEFFVTGECTVNGAFSTNMTGDTSTDYVIVTYETPHRLVGTVTYSDGTEYFRQQVDPDSTTVNLYFLAVSTFPASEVLFELRDYTGGQFLGSKLTLQTYVDGSLENVMSDYFTADNYVNTFLSNSRRYVVLVENGIEERNLGWISESAAGTIPITISYLAFTGTEYYLFRDLAYSITYNASFPSVKGSWTTKKGTTSLVTFKIYNVTEGNGTLLFEDTSTAQTGIIEYNVSWDGINDTYRCELVINHNGFSEPIREVRKVRIRTNPLDIDWGYSEEEMIDLSFIITIFVLFLSSAKYGAEGCLLSSLFAAFLQQIGWFSALDKTHVWMLIIISLFAIVGRYKK